jgi:arginyl-tRNA synthetase
MTDVREAPAFQPLRTTARAAVERAWRRATETGSLPEGTSDADQPLVEVSRPSKPEHGDLATNLALKLARPLRQPPMKIAGAIAEALQADSETAALVERVEVAPPGFLNLHLQPGSIESALDAARHAESNFGRVPIEPVQRINVEFVSANPTGPLTVGNARGAFVGDLLCRVLEAAGQEVVREYYFNDSGRQVDVLGASVAARRLGEELPEDSYRGAYVDELAAEVPEHVWDEALAAGPGRDRVVGGWAAARVRSQIEESLERLGVHFDVWKSETSLYVNGSVATGIERLREAGHVYEADGAVWFRSTAFGDDKDRVLYRSNGEPTYFASDVGYLADKFGRGFDRLVYIWGEDHHGTVARVRNAAAAMGHDRDSVEMQLVAWVRFVRDGVEIPMSKRSGEFITLDELLAEVGVDAARWFFAARAYTTGIDFDIELARKQSSENPVYYVQYAHARICSILRKAADAGITPADTLVGSLSADPIALGLAREVLRLPEVVEDSAREEATQGVTTYATALATTFHAFYRDRRVVDPGDAATSASRLALVDATRLALANALGLLGISAPERM